ncbi:hypothetical protein GCM10007938_07090 [Vibrio zhanjiangensis]|uniref:DUF2645 family protein n=1 Tax=Vibrio zhanjiangensis TaxID=1046128 RepID=A0ABQ6EWM6_9VIBR|nr:hypothetical protein [Vibrio zhanjiangensis]GLT16932.1 hypothetical protein GCM10007938_07090 [Vibrio zhanjiangensis]
MSIKSKILLFIPLLVFIHIWLTFVFGVDVTPDWLFYDTQPHSEDPSPTGLLPDNLYFVIMFIACPLSFFIGSIYTIYKKLWGWFAAYLILGFGLWLYLAL